MYMQRPARAAPPFLYYSFVWAAASLPVLHGQISGLNQCKTCKAYIAPWVVRIYDVMYYAIYVLLYCTIYLYYSTFDRLPWAWARASKVHVHSPAWITALNLGAHGPLIIMIVW